MWSSRSVRYLKLQFNVIALAVKANRKADEIRKSHLLMMKTFYSIFYQLINLHKYLNLHRFTKFSHWFLFKSFDFSFWDAHDDSRNSQLNCGFIKCFCQWIELNRHLLEILPHWQALKGNRKLRLIQLWAEALWISILHVFSNEMLINRNERKDDL